MTRKRSGRVRAQHHPDQKPFTPIRYTSDVFPVERADPDPLPTGRHAGGTGRPTQQEGPVGRRSWYHPRPQPKRAADVMGFNATWWLVAVVLVVVLVLVF